MPNAFKQGDHICALYESEHEQLSTAAAYVADGLTHAERCYYVGQSQQALTRFRESLSREGIDVADAVKGRALILATHHDAHLVGGRFDCERMLRLLNGAVEAALNDGFIGLRTCGDMSWLLDRPAGSEQVVEYEMLLNQFFHAVRAMGMCQYDARRLPPDLVDQALCAHSSVAVDGRHVGNPHYSPALVVARRAAASAVELQGKVEELRRLA
jgi:MEDS: MEthanogen/methylotroph, DcmR Sensory domain